MIEKYVDGVKTVNYSNDVYPLEFQVYSIITNSLDSYTMYPVGLNQELKNMINIRKQLVTDIRFNNEQIERYKDSDLLHLQILVNNSIAKNIHHNEMLLQIETHINKIKECIITFKDRYNKKYGRKSPFIECRLSTDMQAVQDELKESNNVIPVNTNNIEKVQDKIYQSFKMNDTIEYKTISQQIKSLDNEINLLEDKRIQLSNYIRNELNIKCNYNKHLDIKECKEYITINNLMDIKEAEFIQLQENKKIIASDNFNKYKDNLIKCYDNNKYRIVLHDRIEYSNSIESYKSLECNISIFMLINNEKSFIELLVYKKEYDNNLYNSNYNKVCKLESIYNYCNDKYLLLDESIILNDKLISQLSSRYDNSNNKIYSLMYFNNNNYRESYINIKSNYMIQYDTFNCAENTIVYYNIGLMKTIEYIPVEYQEYINKINEKLNNNTGLKLVG
jgi:hypothetical protein